MNIESGDALLTSIWPTDDLAGASVDGLIVDLGGDDLILDGQLKVRFKVLEDLAAGAASNVTFAAVTGEASPPGDALASSPALPHDQLLAGYEWAVVLPKGVQKRFVQLTIAATEALTGGSIQADLQPIKS